MKKNYRNLIVFSFILMGILFPLSGVFAQAEVKYSVSTKQTYVDQPIVVTLQILNSQDYDLPQWPEIEGLTFRQLAPSTSSQISSINGRTTRSTAIVYRIVILAAEPGDYKIPELDFSVDGLPKKLPEIEFVVRDFDSANDVPGNLLHLEVVGQRDEIFVGEQITLTLKILIKPFESSDWNVRISDVDMWQLKSRSSKWGVFSDTIERLRQRNVLPKGEEQLRDFGDGKSSYYCFEIPVSVNPTKPGPIEFDDVRIVWDYPTKLERARNRISSIFGSGLFDDDFFGSRGGQLQIQSSRTIAAKVDPLDIDVKPIPTDGQPDDYRGAIGNYSIRAVASNRSVSVGEPIELQLEITGDGPLTNLSPPPLSELRELTNGFKVARNPLAGEIENGAKYFTTTIRPRSSDVTEIPSIPFSFFDPAEKKFETVFTDAIPIDVEETELLDLATQLPAASNSDDQQSGSPKSIEVRKLEPVKYGQQIVASYSADKNLPTWLSIALIAPAVFGIGLILKFGLFVLSLSSRLTSPARIAQKRIVSANEPIELADAVVGFVIGSLKSSNNTDLVKSDRLHEAAGLLRQNDQYADAAKLESLVEKYGRQNIIESNDRGDAERLLTELKRAVKVRRVVNRQLANFGGLLFAFSCMNLAPDSVFASSDLAVEQKSASADLEERNPYQEFNSAVDLVANQELGAAKITLIRARKLAPTESRIGLQLAALNEKLQLQQNDSLLNSFQIANWNIRSVIGDSTCNWGLALVSIAFWSALLGRVFIRFSGFKWIAGVSSVILALFWASFALTRIDLPKGTLAVVTGSDAKLRDTDSPTASISSDDSLPIGSEVDVIAERSGWVKIENQLGATGWIRSEMIERL